MSAKDLLSRIFSPPVILGLGLIFLVLVCVYPFLQLLSKVSFSGADGGFDPQYFIQVLESKSSVKAILNTIWVSLGSALISVCLALPLSWVLTRTNVPGASRLRSYFCLPYAIPPYIGAIAWIYLANPTNGYLNLPFESSWINIYSFGGLIWVMATFFYTFVLLLLLGALDRTDASLEEAARLSGASPVRVFFDVTLPLIKPALFGGAILVVLAAAASFGVPAMIGNPARIFLVTTKIYTYQKMGSMSGIYQAGALSIYLLVGALVVLYVNQWVQKRYSYQVVGGKVARPSVLDLGKWRWPMFSFLIVLLGVLFFMPLSGIVVAALSKIPGQLSLDNFGLQNFHRIFFETNETPRALWNSTYLGAMAATAAVALGVLVSYIQWKTKLRGRKWLDIVASLPYSTPGTVVALALILSFSGPLFGIGPSLYNTLGILWLAYFIKYLSFAVRTTGDGFSQIDNVLAEAAQVSGASWLTVIKTIWLPLLKPSLIAAWFLIFMPAFSELTMTIMLSGPGIETLGTLLFQLQEYADASGGGGSAVLALVVVIGVTSVNALIKYLSKGKYGL